jgi:hypothetical protein
MSCDEGDWGLKTAWSIQPMDAPTNCAATNALASAGAMPEKVSLIMRPNTAAGFAKEVLAVNQ